MVLYRCDDTDAYVIPDAAGYRLSFIRDSIDSGRLKNVLVSEISKYRIGVNQVEKGFCASSSTTGFGWDISCLPNEPVQILHTGSERIGKFDLLGVRFPTQADMEAQKSMKGCTNHYKFATYPVRENHEAMTYERFHCDLDGFRCACDTDCSVTAENYTGMQLQQLPSLFNVIGQVVSGLRHEIDDPEVKTEIERCATGRVDPSDTPLVSREEGVRFLLQTALACINFNKALRTPGVLAMVLDFPESNLNFAECGDKMTCITLLPY